MESEERNTLRGSSLEDGGWKESVPPNTAIMLREVVTSASNETQCPVCKVDWKQSNGPKRAVATRCSHVFHYACLSTWLSISIPHPTCPMCRASLASPIVDPETFARSTPDGRRAFLLALHPDKQRIVDFTQGNFKKMYRPEQDISSRPSLVSMVQCIFDLYLIATDTACDEDPIVDLYPYMIICKELLRLARQHHIEDEHDGMIENASNWARAHLPVDKDGNILNQ